MTDRATETEPAPQAASPSGPLAAPLLFVGGTGRSGTHVVARMLSHHPDYANVPLEARFHCDPGGFPDLLRGATTVRAFTRRVKGRWWRRIDPVRMAVYGMRRTVDRRTRDEALAAFRTAFPAAPEDACRNLFFALLGPLAAAEGKPGLIEQSCDTVAAAPALHSLFPQAKFIHVIRDGRDVAASRSSQTRGLVYPRNIRQGLEWWESRLRRIDAATAQLPEGAIRVVNLDNLVEHRRDYAITHLMRFVGGPGGNVRRFHRNQMSPESANRGRWRSSL